MFQVPTLHFQNGPAFTPKEIGLLMKSVQVSKIHFWTRVKEQLHCLLDLLEVEVNGVKRKIKKDFTEDQLKKEYQRLKVTHFIQ